MPTFVADESNGNYVPLKEIFPQKLSPKSPLSPRSPQSDSIDLAKEGLVDTSLDQLYQNICEMQSSDQSPSQPSLGSDGDESRIDSELRHLVGGVKLLKEQVKERQEDVHINKETKNGSKNKNSEIKEKFWNGKSSRKPGSRFLRNKKRNPKEEANLNVAPFLLKQAKEMISSPRKALELATRAMKLLEKHEDEKQDLELVSCLHFIGGIYCNLGEYVNAIPILERAIEIPEIEKGINHALIKFSGCMQLGDIYAILGQIENSILFYTAGLEIQRQSLGERDSRFAETCRYVAEAHVQALQFDEAEKLCKLALDVHRENGSPGSLEEATDRRLMGLICQSKGQYEDALENFVLANMAMSVTGHENDVAYMDISIGDAYMALARFDEAIFAYQKALTLFKSTKGENHPYVAFVFIHLANLYNEIGKFRESKSYCENALRIYEKPNPGILPEEIATGFIEISAIYESMNELEKALKLLKQALKIYGSGNSPFGREITVAGIEAQIGVIYYVMGKYSESYNSFENAVSIFRASGERKTALFGIVLNQMGLVCVQRLAINEAADFFEEARSVLEKEYGPHHPDTLGIYSNLAATYDALGRLDDAIEILDHVVSMRENKLGTPNVDMDDEKQRLTELLKEAKRVRNKDPGSLEALVDNNFRKLLKNGIN